MTSFVYLEKLALSLLVRLTRPLTLIYYRKIQLWAQRHDFRARSNVPLGPYLGSSAIDVAAAVSSTDSEYLLHFKSSRVSPTKVALASEVNSVRVCFRAPATTPRKFLFYLREAG